MAVNSELSDLIDAAANRSTSLLIDAKAAMGAGLQAINGIDTVANQVTGLALVAPQAIDLTAVNNIPKPDMSPFSGLFSLSDFGNEPNAPGDDNLSYDGPGGFSGSRPGLPNTNDPVYKSPGTAPSNRPNAPGITAPKKPSDLPQLNADFPKLEPIGSTFSGRMPIEPNFGSPNVQEPVRPGPTPTFNKTAPKLNTPTGPSAPSAFSGTAPTMTSITLPAAPNSVIPSFNGQRPADVAAPGDAAGAFSSGWMTASAAFRAAVDGSVSAMLSRFNPQYDSALATMESKLAEMVRGDTETGFSPAVEQAIYGRSQSKQDAEARRVSDEAMSRAARMGFTMPSGSLMGSLQKARQAAADNNATASREIVVMQAEMQQKNMQFAITTSAQLRQAVMNAAMSYHGNMIQLNGHAVQYANGIADAMTKTYDSVVKAYSAKLDGYRADASVFEALVSASRNEVEIYKAKIEGELAKVKVDEAQVSVYRAQVEGHQAVVKTYETHVQALVALASLEKTKIDAFEAEVRAYTAQVQASEAEWGAYSAAWSGEETKVKALLAQAQVYTAQVDGYKAAVSADAMKVDSAAKVNSSLIEAYEAQIRAYTAEVDAKRAEWAGYSAEWSGEESKMRGFTAEVQAFGSEVDAYKSEVQAASIEFEAQAKVEQLKLEGYAAEARAFASEVDAYKAEVQAASTAFDAEAKVEQLKLSNYEARVRAWGEKARAIASQVSALIQAEETTLRAYQVASQAAIQTASAQADKYRAEASFNVESAKLAANFSLDTAKMKSDALRSIAETETGAAKVYSGLAEAAMSGITTLVTLKEDVSS